MFFFLSKTVSFLFSPLSWIVILFLLSLLPGRPARRKRCILAGTIMILFFTNPFFRNTAFRLWETPSLNPSEINPAYDAGILLGGAMRYYNSETGRVVYGNSVDRLIQAMTLYRTGKIRKLLITGGSGFLLQQNIKEAELLKQVVLQFAVPDSDILVETRSRNTYENAVYSAAVLKNRFPGGRFLVITSAYHMRRSMACFEKAGIAADAFAVDQYAGKGLLTPDAVLVPAAANLEAWDILLHEWMGFLAYRIAGYL